MEKLKTLKDFDEWNNSVGIKEELKAEAVKWYKEISNMSALVFIKHFFNITKEDLKGEEEIRSEGK